MRRINWLRFFVPPARVWRLTAWLTFAFLCCSALAARAVYGQAKEAALAFGQQLIGLEDLTNDAEVILVNGERFHRANGASTAPLSVVLDRIEEYCEKSPGLIGQTLSDLDASHPNAFKKRPLPRALRHGVMRQESADRGMVACFTDSRITGVKSFAEAAARFAKTSDLGEFGRFRYAFASRKDDKTHVATLWADTSINLSTMFPASGDAPGTDSDVLPRPPESRRTLAASSEGMPYGLRLYETREPREKARMFYENWMKAHGWQVAGRAPAQGGVGFLSPDGYQAVVTVGTNGDLSFVSLTEAGRAGGQSISTVRVSE